MYIVQHVCTCTCLLRLSMYMTKRMTIISTCIGEEIDNNHRQNYTKREKSREFGRSLDRERHRQTWTILTEKPN